MGCADIVYRSIIIDVNKEVKSVVHSGSDTVKTDNSLKCDTVETLNMVPNDTDTVESFDSVNTGNLIEQDKHCELHCILQLVYLLCFFEGIRKERSKPHSERDQNKACKACFFCKSLVFCSCFCLRCWSKSTCVCVCGGGGGGHLKDFWKTLSSQGASPRVVSILKKRLQPSL